MKHRLVGGLILLNLCAISLSLSAGEQDITNEDVLNQLVGLREYIDEKRDFTKESKGLKPVLVQYRSSVSKIDGIVECNLSFNTDALHLSIGGYSVQADGTPITLTINVVYEWTEYIGYTIKSAKINATNEFNALKVTGDEIVENMSGYSFTPSDDDEITYVYAGIVKNGNKLTLVLAFNFEKTEDKINVGLGSFKVPSSVADKLYPTLIGAYNYLAMQDINGINSDFSRTNRLSVDITKGTNSIDLTLGTNENLPLNTRSYVRVEQTFLLGDNLISNE